MENFPNLSPEEQEKILNGPAMQPPPGVTPNFAHPHNHNKEATAFLIVCSTLVVSAALTRAYSRVFVMRKVYMEDWLGLAAFVSYLALIGVVAHFLIVCGIFVHQWDLRFRDMPPILKSIFFGLNFSHSAVQLFAKTAILREWIRIFTPHHTRNLFYWTCYFSIILNLLLSASSTIAFSVVCLPHESVWKPWVHGKCMNRKVVAFIPAVFNLVMDLLIMLLPQGIIWRLRMTKSRKIGVSLIFSVGILAVACAAGRIAPTVNIQYKGDGTYTASPVILWLFAESTCAMLVFCMPAIPTAFAEQGIVYRFTRSIMSWPRLSLPGSNKSFNTNKTKTKPPTIGQLSGSHTYKIMADENGQAIDLSEMDLRPLKDSNPRMEGGQNLQRVEFQPRKEPDLQPPPSCTIMKTTIFEQREDFLSRNSSNNPAESQHSWI